MRSLIFGTLSVEAKQFKLDHLKTLFVFAFVCLQASLMADL